MNAQELVDFLTARLDEKEARARAAFDESGAWRAERYEARLEWWVSGEYGGLASTGYVGNGDSRPIAEQIADNDPAYVLDDIAAKRRIIELVQQTLLRLEWSEQYSVREVGRDVLCLLAAPFSSHPDYRKEWQT